MIDSWLRAGAVALDIVWVAALLFRMRDARGFAIAANVSIALVFCAFALPPLIELVADFDKYVTSHGRAALGDLPATITVVILSVLAIALSLASRRRAPGYFFAGWLANAPALAFMTYLAFWFRIF
jgi:hypothetical protein